MRKSFPVWWWLAGFTLLGLVFRLWRLAEPGVVVFDETYYAVWAKDYLERVAFFDVHPPLAKLLVAVGIQLFGDHALGWRIVPALLGSLLVPLTFGITRRLFGDDPHRDRIALLAAFLIAFDGLMLVVTRLALIEGVVLTLSLLTYWSFLYYLDAQSSWSAIRRFLLLCFCCGLVVATKWTGLAVVGALALWAIIYRKRLPRIHPLVALAGFALVPALYIGSFAWNVHEGGFLAYVIDWHHQAWQYHAHLGADHPYESRWWSWLLLVRPVWYFYESSVEAVQGIIALGNPAIWWSATLSLFASVVLVLRKRLQHPLLLPLIAFLATYVPWIFIGRLQFQYYIAQGLPFFVMMLAWWLNRGLHRNTTRLAVWYLLGLIAALFVFWLPLYTALPVSQRFYELHIWFRSWI